MESPVKKKMLTEYFFPEVSIYLNKYICLKTLQIRLSINPRAENTTCKSCKKYSCTTNGFIGY